MTRPDVAIVGGGPAGAAAAIRLATAGARVLLLEREPAPVPKVCGEFLSGEALADLRSLGLDPCALGAHAVSRLRLTAGSRSTTLPLPFAAAGLSRLALDAALLERAETAGATIRRGAAVRSIDGSSVLLATGERIEAGRVLLATGKRDLPGLSRDTTWRGRDEMLALKLHIRLPPARRECLAGAVTLHLFPGGHAGLQPIEGDAINLCITLTRSLYTSCDRSLPVLIARLHAASPSLAADLAGAQPLADRPLAIARVPYGYSMPVVGDAFRAGDQAAVTPSVTGDGVAIALRTGIRVAEAILAGETPPDAARGLRALAGRQLGAGMVLQAVVDRTRLHGPAVAAASLLPPLARWLARRTRLPQPATASSVHTSASATAAAP
jgi:menaquinone-9 beta-reductase